MVYTAAGIHEKPVIKVAANLVSSPAVLEQKYVWQKLCTKLGVDITFVVQARARVYIV